MVTPAVKLIFNTVFCNRGKSLFSVNQLLKNLRFSRLLSNHFNLLSVGTRMIALTNPSMTSKASFQVNGFGGTKLVGAKEMYQFGIIPVDQGVYFLNAESF